MVANSLHDAIDKNQKSKKIPISSVVSQNLEEKRQGGIQEKIVGLEEEFLQSQENLKNLEEMLGESEESGIVKENQENKTESIKPQNTANVATLKTQDDKNFSLKTTLSSFAQQIKESIKQYKPPLTKLSIDLNPEKLGKIELSITKKGKDLHISITSNTQAINMFAQNQVDLRQNLQNIGFNNIDFNFSQNGSSQQKEEGKREKRNKNSLQEYQEIEEISNHNYDTLEIVLPKYA
ncbi:flagellar hook-length control protein FliK [Helicobacter anatolicus]|uniref:flagellar hook-length control protein FliK n=1 Tax=Helicobacter anatolicus TaxID=2905874 RepID=UPI001E60D158